MEYNSIERIKPRWREKWRRPIIKLGRSSGIIIPKPILTAFAARPGKNVYIGWVIDMESGRDLLVIDFG